MACTSSGGRPPLSVVSHHLTIAGLVDLPTLWYQCTKRLIAAYLTLPRVNAGSAAIAGWLVATGSAALALARLH